MLQLHVNTFQLVSFFFLLQGDVAEGYFNFTVQLKMYCCMELIKGCFIMEEPSGVVSPLKLLLGRKLSLSFRSGRSDDVKP